LWAGGVVLGPPSHTPPPPRSGERIEKLNFLLRAAERIQNCPLADVPALVRF
jgi:enolase